VCDLETSRIGAPYIYNVRLLRVKPHTPLSSSATLICPRLASFLCHTIC